MNPAILLLTDSRLPAGAHAHSGGIEQAISTGAVHDLPTLAAFLRGRLRTSGRTAAALAAAACALAARAHPWTDALPPGDTPDLRDAPPRRDAQPLEDGPFLPGRSPAWEELDAEVDARTASPALRKASRTQGRLLLRVAARLWPSPVLDDLARTVPSPHHPIALGAAAHAAGAAPGDAALAAAYQAITGPATAAVRLLGLDPVAVHRLLADLTPELGLSTELDLGSEADLSTELDLGSELSDGGPVTAWAGLPAHAAPALDLLAERHAQAHVRLFIS
ncbi:urease accessory protein UreF [Nonomuraea sp. SBT364]|uniref:urease accessory protein UreF n=1 Tax=Nonomuraea sp. SBT364 TaxID=1580530 RepID=UPI0007C8575C|nr:urease accessory UreF family protein [Nonomuraea sp. SBT364]